MFTTNCVVDTANVDPGPLRDVLTVGLGVVTGIMSGAFGVGGAVISTPGIRLLGATPIEAVGTTLPSVLPSALSGTLRYTREHLVDWRAVALTTPAGIAAAVGGALLVPHLPGDGHPLMILTALLLFVTGVRMTTVGGRPSREEPPVVASRAVAPPMAVVTARRDQLVATGVLAGGLSGLLGIGGGVVMVPAFTQWARMDLKRGIATSLVCVGVFAIPGTITHAIEGDIDWRFAVWLCVGVVPGARIGAALSLRTGERRLRLLVGGFLSALAVVYAVSEIVALSG
jgi:uncharacterized membrane protein YfcA